jgi:hypothetical protein
MGDKATVQSTLDHGFRLLAKHENPTRPENHFVIDPTKWDFYAMDCYWLVGDNKRASEHAREVIRLSQRADGTDKSPMRASEARFVPCRYFRPQRRRRSRSRVDTDRTSDQS